MKYSNYFSIDKNFQSSVNLELDFDNEAKIEEYIPTSDICDVLKRYIKCVLGENKDYATTLIGPYGKGKSFLLLVLTFLLKKDKQSITWTRLADKIKLIDEELYLLLMKIKEKNISLLPILVNSNFENVTQAFQIALNNGLSRVGLDSFIPKSVFDVCLSLLDRWNTSGEISNDKIATCLTLHKTNLASLRKGLKSYSQKAYDQFVEIYNCVNIGLEFNPLISNDIVKTYADLSKELKKHGYNGFFIVFDEFSKFVEGNPEHLMHDLKIVQDLAELCSRSTMDAQVHLCCVAHKSLALYADKDSRKRSPLYSFKTVEGRFKEVKFNRSLEENYQIIAYAIKKNWSMQLVDSFIEQHHDFYSGLKELNIFDQNTEETLFRGCFPLNPLTAYSLIRISEYSAQNERTLFTFLADTDDNSFNSFILSNSIDDGLFNVDKIYDYFSPLLQKEDTNQIRNLWYRTESILSKLEDSKEKKIVKALAIILMIGDYDRLAPLDKTISLALMLDEKETKSIIEGLMSRHYLRKNMLNGHLSFALSNTKQIDETIETYKQTKFKNINYADVASEINEHNFALPRKYNEQNKILRFYKVIFMSENFFMNVQSFDYYFETNYCDGIVINLLKDKLSDKEIKEKINSINDDRVIVKYPRDEIDSVLYESLMRYACLNEAKKQKGLDDIALSEINLFLEETLADCRTLIDKYFANSYYYYSSADKENHSKSFAELTSYMMEKLYSFKLIFNNELINKRDVTAQYQKPINNIIDYLLDGEKSYIYSPTSPETSTKFAVLDCNNSLVHDSESAKNFRIIIDEIKDSISASLGKKINVVDIIAKYNKPPYGVRIGVLPIILAKAISELSDNVILYYQSKEITLNSINIVKAITNDKYQISFSKGSNAQREYLTKMMKLYNCFSTNNFRKDTQILAEGIKRYFISMPQIVRLNNKNNNYLGIDNAFIDYKNLFLTFNLNPYEVVFDKPKEIFSEKNYELLFKKIKTVVTMKDNLMDAYKQRLITATKEQFELKDDSSLKSGVSDFIKHYVKEDETPVLDSSEKKVYECILNCDTYDDYMYVNKLAKCITNQFIEDWDSDKSSLYMEGLSKFLSSLISAKTYDEKNSSIADLVDTNKELSGMGSLLKNSIESTLNEFADSVSADEKMQILASLLKGLI